jgi:hypothetical protein
VLRSELRAVDAVAMNKILDRLHQLLTNSLDDQVFRDFLRETVHDYRPAGENVIQISSHSKANTRQ